MYVTEIVEVAKKMLERGQDWSPEADKLLSADNSLSKLEFVIARA